MFDAKASLRHIKDGMRTNLITKENARAYAAKSAESRRKFPLRQIRPEPPAEPVKGPSVPADAQAVICGPVPADDGYRSGRLARTRSQIELLDEMLIKAEDAVSVDRITNSLRRLYDVEADLAGRPGRGNRKPAPERSGKAGPRIFNAAAVPSGGPVVVPQTAQPAQPPTEPPTEPPKTA